jgi:hypothetical protein
MMKDAVVNQVRLAREQHTAKSNNDLRAIVADARKRQQNSEHRVVPWLQNQRIRRLTKACGCEQAQ